jgi:hypothetical protein
MHDTLMTWSCSKCFNLPCMTLVLSLPSSHHILRCPLASYWAHQSTLWVCPPNSNQAGI